MDGSRDAPLMYQQGLKPPRTPEGGRAEPLGDVMKASDIHVETGGELIGGLGTAAK